MGSLGILIALGIVAILVLKVFGSEESFYLSDCNPYNIDIVNDIENHSADIVWNTKGKCTGYVIYGDSMKDLSLIGIDTINESKSKKHSVKLTSLLSTKTYYFTIVSNDIKYGKNGLPISFSLSEN